MKVTNNKIGPLAQKPEAKTSQTDSAAATGLKSQINAGGLNTKESVKNSANVVVSERALMAQKAKQLASSPDTIDEAKVARLQKLIDDGKYKVDADKIADRLIDEHLQIPD